MNGEEEPLWVFRLTSGLAARLAPLSLILFVGSLAIYVVVARQTLQAASIPYVVTILTPLLVIALHEALHGLGIVIFGGRPKFGAGIRGAVPYFFATCPGMRFSWGRTLVIGALPLVTIDVAALALAGYGSLVVPAMLAFAVNSAGAAGDLWLIGVILQTPRTTSFEDSDEPAMIAWAAPGTRAAASPPRGLDPRGFESVVIWGGVASALFVVVFTMIGFVAIALARASADGTLAVGGFLLASSTTVGGRLSAHVSVVPALTAAVVLTVALTLAARRLTRHR
jgi:hypothetical protein